MSTILITGCSRGLGLELVKQYSAQAAKEGGLVIATARNLDQGLSEMVSQSNDTVKFVALDIADKANVADAAKEIQRALAGRPLDVLINSAGVYATTEGTIARMDDLEFQLSVNVTGAHNVIRELLPLMQESKVKKVASVSSAYASMVLASNLTFASCPAYKISKAALNALIVQFSLDYKDEDFIFFVLSPGWLQSEMGGKNADLTVPQGAEAVRSIVDSADQKDNGCFKNIHVPGWDQYDGKDLPW
ncbi:hypothetical protein BDW69DRAFT_160747 [Aspergillus filifer]